MPETETDVALLVLQETVVAPGSVALEGLAEIEAEVVPAGTKFAVTVRLLWMPLMVAVVESPVHPVNCQPAAALALRAVLPPSRIPLGGLAEAEHPAEAAAAGEMFTVTE